MRGLALALFALDFPGREGSLHANRWAGRFAVPFLSMMTTTKTISKKTTRKTV